MLIMIIAEDYYGVVISERFTIAGATPIRSTLYLVRWTQLLGLSIPGDNGQIPRGLATRLDSIRLESSFEITVPDKVKEIKSSYGMSTVIASSRLVASATTQQIRGKSTHRSFIGVSQDGPYQGR